MIVSLDGACAEHNDPHRGKGSFERIVAGIRRLNQVGVKPTLNSVISNMNADHARELLIFVEENFEVQSHRLMHLSQLGRGQQSEYDMEDWRNYKKLHHAMLDRIDNTPPEVLSHSIRNTRITPKKNCGMGSGEIYIDSTGICILVNW